MGLQLFKKHNNAIKYHNIYKRIYEIYIALAL